MTIPPQKCKFKESYFHGWCGFAKVGRKKCLLFRVPSELMFGFESGLRTTTRLPRASQDSGNVGKTTVMSALLCRLCRLNERRRQTSFAKKNINVDRGLRLSVGAALMSVTPSPSPSPSPSCRKNYLRTPLLFVFYSRRSGEIKRDP